MKISVVIATYNGAKFIEEQLNTIATQTRMPDELIVSDDGSKDETVDIVKKYIANHNLEDKWRIHVNSQNKGYAKNFLDAALMANSEIIFFCDQDDLWAVDRLDVMSRVMQKNQDINLLCSNLEPFYYEEDTRIWNQKDLDAMTNDGSLERHTMNAVDFHLKRSGCTMCVRKSFMEEIMPYWVTEWAHDDFVWKMATVSNACAILQYNSMKRRMHSSNASVVRYRTREWRINQLRGFTIQYNALEKYAQYINVDIAKINVIRINQKAVRIRQDVVAKRQLFKWIILLFRYKECYPRIKGLYLDLYISIFNKYKGAN